MSVPSPSTAKPRPASVWKLSRGDWHLPLRPLVMGILNVTPDSFSDGGQFFSVSAAVNHGLKLAAAGADVIDIGGQSTRPGSAPITAAEELARTIPVVQRLAAQLSIPLSIDTSKAIVAREAVAAGAQIINDVTACTEDSAMLETARASQAAMCLMHMRGTPATMQIDPHYDDVVGEVLAYLGDRRDAAEQAGIERSRIALDPGIGFGKTTRHNLELLQHAARFHELGCCVLVGHSRKRFLGDLIGNNQADRLPATIGVALALAAQGVQILRVHDVAQVRQALDSWLLVAGG